MNFPAVSRWLLLLSLLAGTSLQAHANAELENWRVAVIQTRGLAENDIPLAYAKVKRLQADMPQEATPADKVRLLNLLARIALYRADSSQTEHYAQQAIQLAEANGDRAGQAEAYLTLSLNSVNQSDFELLKSSIQSSMELLQGGDRPDLLVEAMLRTSMMYLRFGRLDDSTAMAMQTLDIAKRSNNPLALTYAHQGMATVYEHSSNSTEAREQYNLMLRYAQDAHSRLLEADALLGLGNILSDLGNIASGERLVQDAVRIYRKAGGPFYTAHALFVMAEFQRKQRRYSDAVHTLSEAEGIYVQGQNKVGRWWILFALSQTKEQMGRLGPANVDAERGYKLAREIGLPLYLKESARRLAALAAIHGDYRKAYAMSTEADEMSKKSAAESSRKRITDITERLEQESKQRKINELMQHNKVQAAQQRVLWTVLLASIGFLGLTWFFLMRLRGANRKLQAANDSLDQTSNTLKATLDAVPDMLFELGLDGTYYDFHSPQTELLVRPAEQLLGRKISDVLPAEASDICLAGLQEANERGLALGKQYSLILPQGRCWFEMSVARKPVAAGESPRFIALVRDITERKQNEEELRDHRERLEDMVTERAAALRASEARLRALIDNLPFEFWGMDSELRYTMQNSVSLKNYGSVVGKSIEALGLPPDIAAQWIAQDKKVLGGELLHEQYEKEVAGEHRTFESLVAPVFVDEQVVGIVGVGIDITERKQMENALRKSQQVLNEAQRITQVGSWEMDLQSNVLTWSDEVYRIFEIDPQQFGASYEAFMNTVHPDDRESLDRIYKTSLEKRERFEFEHRLLLPDGRVKYVFERCENYYDDDGRALRSIGTVQDISVRKEMENALRESRQLMAEAQRIAQVGSWEYDFASDTHIWSDELYRIYEIDPAEGASYEGCMNATHPVDREAVANAYLNAVETGRPYESEHRLLMQDGRIKYVHERGETVCGPDGTLLRAVGMMQDITERKHYEQELRRTSEFQQTLLKGIKDAGLQMMVLENGRAIHVSNLEFAEKMGYSAEAIATQPNFLDIIHPDDRARVAENYRRRINGEPVPDSYELSVVMADGSRREHEVAVSVIPGTDPVRVITISRDITERKRMEAALQESKARYRDNYNQLQSMLESAASVSVFALDRGYRYLFFNNRHREGAKHLRGTDIEIGMNMVESIPDPEFREFCRQGFDRVLAGNVVSVESKEKLVKDGVTTYEYNDNYGSPIFNDQGEVVGLTVFVINTTERKQLEAELMASRNFLDSVLDAVPDPIFVKDRQHRWILLNDANCRFTGLSREALLGKSDYDIFPEAEADVFWEKDELVFNSGEVNLNEEEFTSADGVTHHIQTKKTPFVSADGQQMLVGVIRDITERMNYEAAREAALAEAQRLASLRSEFIAHMSHELRTPLNGILGYAQMLGRDEKLNEKQLASVEVIRHSGEHLLALIEDILDLARIESGRMQFELTDVPLRKFLNSVVGMVSIRARAKQIDLISEFASDLPQGIRCDEKRLRQVLLNLLSNAVKFTDIGQVTLTVARVSPSRLGFTITDTGIGIAQEDREKIFKAFEQVGDRRYRVGGTGLGLAISRQLICLMGGDITFDSAPGKGSSFHFELELPEVSLEVESLRVPEVEEMIEESGQAGEAEGTIIAPPQAMMRELHRLALLGNMRDIALYTDRIAQEDARYQPFAARIKRLTEQFRSKAILALVEEYLS